MENNIYKLGFQEYYKIKCIKFKQKEKYFYIGKLSIDILEDISVLRPVEKIKKEEKYETSSSIHNLFGLLGSAKEEVVDTSFNRPQDLKRAEEITNYIETDKNALIPNTIIVGGEEKKLDIDDNEKIDFNENTVKDENWVDVFNNLNGIFVHNNTMYIPKGESSVVIIDGQHRFLGLKSLDAKIKKDFEIPVSFLIGYNQIEMAEIFYTINYTQKTVDKSLLTHLKNSFLEQVTKSSIIYEYIKFLNTNENSVLKDKVKFVKGDKGIVSLSFLHSEIENLTKEYSIHSTKIPILAKLFNDPDNSYIVLQIIINYLNATKNILENEFSSNLWKNQNSVFTKSIGLGAFFQILPPLILKILNDKKELSNYKNIKNITSQDFYNMLIPIKNINLKEYEKAGGLGLLGKLKKDMMDRIGLNSFTKEFVIKKKIDWILSFYIDKKTKKSLLDKLKEESN